MQQIDEIPWHLFPATSFRAEAGSRSGNFAGHSSKYPGWIGAIQLFPVPHGPFRPGRALPCGVSRADTTVAGRGPPGDGRCARGGAPDPGLLGGLVRPPLAGRLGDHRALHAVRGAFPLADGWLALCLVAASFCLLTARRAALFWLLAGGGAGIYLFCMDVLYDLEHGVWGKGANGVVELAINVVTLALSVFVLRWAWVRRDALLSS